MIKMITFTAFLSVFIFAETAFAYLDPGTGSAILQGVLAGIAAVAVVLKLYWHRLLKILGIRKSSPDEEGLKSTED